MNEQIKVLISEHEAEGDFTHVAPTAEMLEAAQRALGVTIPQQFVDTLLNQS